LEGVEGVRFTMVFTVTVAANPFHAGTLVLNYQYGSRVLDTDTWQRSSLPYACTQLPHVRLNLAEETMVQLSVPWIADVDYMPLSSVTERTVGIIAINQVIPTPTLTSSGVPTYKMYVHLEDLELIGATTINEQFVTPQSGLRSSQPSGISSLIAEAKADRLLSRGLNATARVVGRVGAAVPSLNAVGGALSWALRAASGVASVFGYSKPRDSTNPSRVQRTDYIGETNVDMPAPHFALAATAENSTRVDSTFPGTDEDEMALPFILSKYSQICLVSLSTSDVTGTRIWASLTNLTNFWMRVGSTKPFCNIAPPLASSATTNCIYPSNLMYWSQLFRYWRGTLKFRFSFGKCKFHAGRVIVGFVPRPNNAVLNARNNDAIPALEVASSLPQPFSYSAIFDLKDDSVFEFEVPYINNTLWTTTNGYTGGLTLTVLDPLIANGECSTVVPILVEVAAGEDFEFAAPGCPSVAPVSGNTGLTVQLQSGMNVSTARRVEEYTTGESIKSAKQLLMMPSSTTYDVANLSQSVTALPSFFYLPRWTNAVPMANPSVQWMALARQQIISACYAYAQGATSYDVYCDAENDLFVMQALQAPVDGNGVAAAAPSLYSGGVQNTAVRITSSKNALHFQVPLYAKTARVAIRDFYGVGANILTRNYSPNLASMSTTVSSVIPLLKVRNSTGRSVRVNLSIAGADDARLGVYLGPPPIYLFNSAQTVSPDLSSQTI
jgi:hypothetical protein